ncbi:MAG: hypothetical protein AYK18_16205 [Theionarchaea archaeon DG-70]|nr:MAG: hypothetical protein AYK18_16205 [Theionarchaea archaeon DG-70]
MRVFEGSLLTFSTRFLSAALSLLAGIITARALGPDGKGQYTLIILLPTLLIYIGHAGLGASSVYFIGKRRYTVAEVTSNLMISAIAIGGMLLVLGLVGILGFNPTFLKDVDRTHITLAIMVTPILLLHTYLMWILLAEQKIREYNILDISRPFGLLIALIFLIIILRGGVFGATIAYIVSAVSSCILGMHLIRRTAKITWSLDFRVIGALLWFGLKNHLGGIAQFLDYRLNLFLVGHFLAVTAVGHYSISIAVAETLWYIPTGVALVLLPKISSVETTEASMLTPIYCRGVFFVTAVLSICYALIGRMIIPFVFGREFSPSVRPLLFLLPGVALFSIPKVLSSDFIGRGKPMLNTYIAFASLAVVTILSLFLIPRFGLIGAAVASSSAYCTSSVLSLLTFWKLTEISPTSVLRPRLADLQLYKVSLARVLAGIHWKRAIGRPHGDNVG